MSSEDWVTHHRLNASLSAGTPCCPSTSSSPCLCPKNPDRDDYRYDKEIRITLLAVERKKQVDINEEWGKKWLELHSWISLASADQ